MNRLFTLIFLIILSSCQEEADRIIESSIQYHGFENFYKEPVEFKFREYTYLIDRTQSPYLYTKKIQLQDSITRQTIIQIDSLWNSSEFSRSINGERLKLTEDDEARFSNSLNSVAYFYQLPLPLKDDAAIITLLENTLIEGKEYATLKVSFSEENGGTDHEDTYRYYFDISTYALSYLSYDFHINDGGVRFRKAYQKPQGNFIFLDYDNYKAPKGTPLDSLPILFDKGKLELLSKIVSE
jgi:hypothetical protein